MKKLCCIGISLLLCIMLGAAFAQEKPQTDTEQTVDLLTLQALGIAPAEMNAEGECTVDELYALMTGAARLKSGKEPQWSTLPEWVEHGSGDAPVTRLLAARLLFECYEQMGNTIQPDTEPVSYANGMITLQGNVWAAQAECADYDVVMNHMAEVEGWHHNGDWHTAPSEWFVGFAMRQKSRLDDGYMM